MRIAIPKRRYISVTDAGPVWHGSLRGAVGYAALLPAGTSIELYRLGRDLRARLIYRR